jgi:hypothetical protein
MAEQPAPDSPDLVIQKLDQALADLAEIKEFIAEHRPALERALRWLGNPVADYLTARRKVTRNGR